MRASAATGAHARLWRYIEGDRRLLLASILVSLASSGATLAQPLVVQRVLDNLDRPSVLGVAVLLLTGLVVVGALMSAVTAWAQQLIAERVARRMRTALIETLVRLSIPEFDRHRPGDLVARVTADTAVVKTAATQGFTMVINGALTFVVAVALMLTVSPILLAVTVAVLALVAVLTGLVLPRMRGAHLIAQTEVGNIGSALERVLGGLRTVKANGAESREAADAVAAVDASYVAGRRAAGLDAVMAMLSGLAMQLSFLGVLGIGGLLVATDRLSVAQLIAFLLFVVYLSSPAASVGSGLGLIQQGLGASDRIEELLRMETEEVTETREGSNRESGNAAGDISFRKVGLRYPDREDWALLDVSFRVPAGTTAAIVGPSGAGKSTVLSLLERFYEPTAGEILLDSVPLASMPRSQVRGRIGFVEQDCQILRGSLRENISYGLPEANLADIERVLDAVGLTSFAKNLPQGLDTDLGTRGVKVSGGQRQRIAAARALIRNPDVLILDEVTAHLDAVNENAMRDLLLGLRGRCTVLLVAHRLSTVVDCDQIVVMQDGQVRSVGRHSDLRKNDELYRQMLQVQDVSGSPDAVVRA